MRNFDVTLPAASIMSVPPADAGGTDSMKRREWLHGDERGSMNRKQNVYGTERIASRLGMYCLAKGTSCRRLATERSLTG